MLKKDVKDEDRRFWIIFQQGLPYPESFHPQKSGAGWAGGITVSAKNLFEAREV